VLHFADVGQLQVPGTRAEHYRVNVNAQQSCGGHVSAEALHQERPALGRLQKVVPPSSALVLAAAGMQQ
jgi:hypothetical protein